MQSELESIPQRNRHGLPKPKPSPTKNPEAKRSILKETEDVTSTGRPLNILPVPFMRPEAHRLRPASAMFEGRDLPVHEILIWNRGQAPDFLIRRVGMLGSLEDESYHGP